MALVAAVWAAPAAETRFEKVPPQALKELAGSRGKPVRTGFVFVNGHYLKPPYVVSRLGTAIFVNGVQVSDQIVGWKAFLLTQPGAAEILKASAPAPVQTTYWQPPSATARSIDDLFDDDFTVHRTPPPRPVRAAPAEPPPLPEMAFTPNTRSRALLKKIDDHRKDIHKKLLGGQMCFFGTHHAVIPVTPRLAASLLETLPEAMRDAADGADLSARLKAKGFGFLNAALCADLIDNRQDYPALADRRRALRDDATLQSLLQNAGQEGLPR